ncbi:amidohydrolase family protein [Duganella sp. sic0402]|uniref:amidohydrolase family protein n=1 Tax=Duganella sp. sic0402 TaxID=2854786 RepID=UPI001C47235E|nr:amidohydrolase family protein [Duganella sp. sic0402]MBV7534864.1 amidohydrolase family protein [Duganella sp. sic0402]
MILKSAVTVLSLATAFGAGAANVQQERLDKLNGKALGRVIYRGATLIDGTSAAPRTDMAIIVKDDRIEAVLPAAQLTEQQRSGARLVDTAGQYVLPGLIDSHVHYATNPDRPYAEAELKRNLYGGVTGVRDMAGDARELAGLSRDALLNRIPSPDIYYASLVAGPSFFNDPRTVVAALGAQPGSTPWLYAVDDKTSLPLAVAQARGTGATGMKIYANLPGTLVRKLIAESKQQKFPVWTHMQVYPASPYDSLGATAVSHVCMIARHVRETGKSAYGHANEPSYAGLTAEDPEIKKYIAALAKSGTIMDATLSVYKTEGPRCHITLAGDITRAMHKAGVKIIAGTDTDNTGEDPFPVLDHELEKLVRYAGFTPQQAIIAATANAAEALGKQKEFGTLEAGKQANMVFLQHDPLQDIGNVRSVVLTVKRGHEFARADYKFTPLPVHED